MLLSQIFFSVVSVELVPPLPECAGVAVLGAVLRSVCPSALEEDRPRLWDAQAHTVGDDRLFSSICVLTGRVLHEEHVELLMEEFAFLKKEVVGKDLLKGSLLFTGQF